MNKPLSPPELAKLIKTAKEESNERWPAMLDMWRMMAKERKAKYEMYVKEGFDRQQALYLCCQA